MALWTAQETLQATASASEGQSTYRPTGGPVLNSEIKMDCPEFISRIDWSLLRKQKQWLLLQSGNDSDGLVCLIDALQDFAVHGLNKKESEIFGLEISE